MLDGDGEVDAVRFPNLARFARHLVPARVHGQPVHLMRSRPARRSRTPGDPIWTDHPDNLFSLLAASHP